MDAAALARLDATLAVLQQDHQNTGGEFNGGIETGIETDTLASVGEVFGLDSLDLDLLLVAAAPDVDANVGLAYGLLRGALGPARPTVGLALEFVGISTMSPSGPNTVAFNGFGFQPSVQLATVAGRTPDTTPRSVTLALSRAGTSLWSAPVTIPVGSTTAAGPAPIVGAGATTLTGTPPAGGPFGVGAQTGIDPSATGSATVTLPYPAVMLTVTAQVGTTPRAGASVMLTPATGTGPPAGTTGPSGVVVFRDLPAGTYTVTAQAGPGRPWSGGR